MKYKRAEHNENNNMFSIAVAMNNWYAEVEKELLPYFESLMDLKKNMKIYSIKGTLMGGKGIDWVSIYLSGTTPKDAAKNLLS